ncbi:NAD(P) transhydrogenase subunit alpha [bacterium]|nr:NAD(P) transhydrogenase subunit alpha [bacterium]
MDFQGITFAVPKEILEGELRVAVTPDTARKMTGKGAHVLMEKGAGIGSFFSDDMYRDAGAEIVGDVEDLFGRATVILKVKEPHYNEAKGKHEVDMMKKGQYLVAFLHPAFPGNYTMVKSLAARGVTSLTLDSIPRISRAQSMDALTSMSTVAGYKAVLIAASKLPKFLPMMGTASGMIQPASVLVIGTGVAGLQAAATAKRLGAVVYGTDIRHDACEQAKSVGAKIVDTGVPQELAVGAGGYARNLSDEWIAREREALRDRVSQSDIIILSALIPGKLAPVLITGEMVKSMRPGSVIVDIAIDQGGNCEISEAGKTFEKHGVTIFCIQNIPGLVPVSSTWMFANNMYNFVDNLIKDGRIVAGRDDEIIAACLLTIDGEIVHTGAREAMHL